MGLGHEFFKRDFTGGNGLFSFVLKNSNPQATTALLDGRTLQHGLLMGGFESLILATCSAALIASRTVNPNFERTLIRVHIGLEDVDDLIADLEAGLERYNALV